MVSLKKQAALLLSLLCLSFSAVVHGTGYKGKEIPGTSIQSIPLLADQQDGSKENREKEKRRNSDKKAGIDSLLATTTGYPVLGPMNDTLFFIYSRTGSFTPAQRAAAITKRIDNLYEDDFLVTDSITVTVTEDMYDIVYHDNILMSISEKDAAWYDKSMEEVATQFKEIIVNSLLTAKEVHSVRNLSKEIGLVLLVLVLASLLFWLIWKANGRLIKFILFRKDKWLRNLSYNNYVFLTSEQQIGVILFAAKIFRWVVYIILLYIMLPVIFSIFPFSRNWSNILFGLIWTPVKKVIISAWQYLPNLFSILVICFVMYYFLKFVRYIFREIETGKLKVSGFHTDWAMPTYSIVKFMLFAFTFILIFPYLPGSDSNIFKGVSVFVGIIFSLGSSTAIANMVAGLVITYMRPFKTGDRIKLGDMTGDVIEKTLLVTRIRTIKNEVITIPNASVLSGNTTNYSIEAAGPGLILNTTVTIGYDVPWKSMHQALIDAALRTNYVLKEPAPFVLQTSLDDFFVSYQINAYTREANLQANIYSDLHQHIQDVCNERGIEILSPHYRYMRDGNMTTIPANYLDKDYQAPAFKVNIESK